MLTRICGGRVLTPTGVIEADVIVQEEKIAGLVGRDFECSVERVVDVTGTVILPGIIDLHAHTRVPGLEYKEDYASASRAAALGGITTFVDMPNVEPPTTTAELLREKRAIASQSCLVDWGHFGGATELAEIPKLATAGAAGFKVFQVTGAYPHDPRLAITDSGILLRTFSAIAKTGLPCLVHPFDQSLFDTLSELAFEAGAAQSIETFCRVYTAEVVWSTAVARLLELQRETGVRLHLLHTHSKRSLELIRQAKLKGQDVTVASDPKYFHLTLSDLEREGARAAPGGYVTEDKERLEEVWRALRDGTIDLADSDHAPHTLEDLRGMNDDPWHGSFGSPQYQDLLSLWLTDVHAGRIELSRLSTLLSENPAKALGVYPEKGVLSVGSDADLVIVDPIQVVHPSDGDAVTKAGWTPYDGRKFVGAPILTMLRGRVIAQDGQVVGESGFAQFVPGRAQGGNAKASAGTG